MCKKQLYKPLIMRHQRLSTQELIKQNREQYNASKYSQQIKEMELTILLKDKQIKSLNLQINSIKQENSVKISLLERQLIDLKKELGQNRACRVRQRRLENQKYQQLLIDFRKQQQLKLQHIQEQNNLRLQLFIKEHHQQLNRTQKKYEQLMLLQKQELKAFVNINEGKNNNINIHISRLQQEKAQLNKLKREAEQRCQIYRQSIQKIQEQFNLMSQRKDEQLNFKSSEIQGLKLEKKLLNQQLQFVKQKQFNSQSYSKQTYQELNRQYNQLSQQNNELKKQIQQKNEQILKCYQSKNQRQSQKMSINPVYQCNHLSLIHQMTKNLDLKDKEIANLKKIVYQWSQLIGFDKPISQRLTQITQKCHNVKNCNAALSESLKKRVKSTKDNKY